MQPFIVSLVLFSALLHATWNAFLHTSEDRVWQFGMMSFPYIVCSAITLLLVPAPARESWPYIAGSAVLQAPVIRGARESLQGRRLWTDLPDCTRAFSAVLCSRAHSFSQVNTFGHWRWLA